MKGVGHFVFTGLLYANAVITVGRGDDSWLGWYAAGAGMNIISIADAAITANEINKQQLKVGLINKDTIGFQYACIF